MSGIYVDDINEKTSAHGVEIDGVSLKDGQVPASAGGSMVLLQSGDLTGTEEDIGSATLLSSTYKIYKLFLSNIDIDTDDKQLRMRLYLGGTLQTGSIYNFTCLGNRLGTTTQLQLRGGDEAFASLSANGLHNDNDKSNFWEVTISNPSTSLIPALIFIGHWSDTSEYDWFARGFLGFNAANQGVLTGLRVYPETGSFERGTYQLYGLKNA